jgi:hypothetical protein
MLNHWMSCHISLLWSAFSSHGMKLHRIYSSFSIMVHEYRQYSTYLSFSTQDYGWRYGSNKLVDLKSMEKDQVEYHTAIHNSIYESQSCHCRYVHVGGTTIIYILSCKKMFFTHFFLQEIGSTYGGICVLVFVYIWITCILAPAEMTIIPFVCSSRQWSLTLALIKGLRWTQKKGLLSVIVRNKSISHRSSRETH